MTATLSLPTLVRMSDHELGRVDPLLMNLAVLKGIPSRADVEPERYACMADVWAMDFARRLPALEREFWKAPGDWKNNLVLFRLGHLCWYVDQVLGVRYREEHKGARGVVYIDPSDLFLDGVMDNRLGTCGNMAALLVVLAWRLGWPLGLAIAGYHHLARYDDGRAQINVEATNTGNGGFSSPDDDHYIQRYSVTRSGIRLAIDLMPLRPRELLGSVWQWVRGV